MWSPPEQFDPSPLTDRDARVLRTVAVAALMIVVFGSIVFATWADPIDPPTGVVRTTGAVPAR